MSPIDAPLERPYPYPPGVSPNRLAGITTPPIIEGFSQPNTEGAEVESTAALAARQPVPDAEHAQTAFELGRAAAAAKTLEERLELAGLDDMARQASAFRAELVELIAAHDAQFAVSQSRDRLVVTDPPCQAFSEARP